MFIDRLRAWEAAARTGAGPRTIFVFEAFDEPWKRRRQLLGHVHGRAQGALCDPGAEGQRQPRRQRDLGLRHVAACDEASALYFKPLTTGPAVTANRFTLFADVATAGEAVQVGDWAAFSNQQGGATADRPLTQATVRAGRRAPEPGDRADPGRLRLGHPALRRCRRPNLSGFSGGSLTAWIKTTGYPGKIEIGIATDTEDRTGARSLPAAVSGDYGYCTTGAWCKVTIPSRPSWL